MAVNEIEIAATPDEVWGVLAEPQAYAEWVVGTKRIRGADEGFPATGTRLHHTVGVGPVAVDDSSLVLRSERPSVLELEARLGPLGSAHVTLRLEERGAGTRVVMHEHGLRGATRLLQPAGDLVVRGRNLLSLERLKDIVEQRG
jgi:uncharacterized protein YndB with AHSA1/START domain